MNKKPRIHPEIRDVWLVARIVQMTIGFNLGLYLFIYGVFFYESFGGESNPNALHLTAIVFMVGNIVMVLSNIPTGALADFMGRKKTVILSFCFRAIFFFLMAWIVFVPSITWAFVLGALAYAIFGIGYTLHDGAFSAWVVDMLRERNHADRVGVVLSRSYGHMALAQAVGAFIALPLYLSGYVFYAFALGFTSCILCAVFCSVMMRENKDIAFHGGSFSLGHSLKKMRTIIVDGFKISAKVPAVGYLVLMYVAFMFLTHVVSYLWPIAMKANFGVGKMSFYWYAVVALSLFLNFLGAKAMELIAHKSPSNVALWLWFMLISLVMSFPVVYLGVKTMEGDVSLMLLVLSVVLCRFGYGFLRPCYDMLVNNYITAEYSQRRATVLSLGGTLISIVVVLLMIPSSGTTGENTTFGWLIPSGILIVLTLVLGFLMRRYQRRIGELPS